MGIERTKKREKERINKNFQAILNRYLETRKKAVAYSEGKVLANDLLTDYFYAENNEWISFANHWNRKRHVVKVDPKAFHKFITDFAEKEKKDVWMGFARHVLTSEYNYDDYDRNELESLHDSGNYSPTDAAIEMVSAIKPLQPQAYAGIS